MTQLRSILFLLLLAVSAQAQLRFTKEVDTIAQLKQLNTLDVNKSCNVKGWLAPNDGGGGLFNADSNSIEATDDGIVIMPNSGVGRWKRVVAGRDYHALWWGGVRTNSVLQAAIDWVSANGWGKVICDGGIWLVKCDDATRILMKTGVTLTTAEDSQLECAPNPADNWILVDFTLGAHDMQVGPGRFLGWNLAAPGGDPNKTGVIFSIKGTENVTIGGVKANNWYSRYIDVDIDNKNINLFDDQWQPGVRAFGAFGDGVTDDTKSAQDAEHFYEFYSGEFFWPPTTNGYLVSSIWITNQLAKPLKITGNKTLIKQFYFNPTEGVLPHPSGVFLISANNSSVSGFKFTTTGPYPITETNTATSGFFVPVSVHIGTNTHIFDCEFDIESGRAITTSGSYTRIENCFFNRCGINTGLGNIEDWLWYESVSPHRGQGYSPQSCSIVNCTFFRGTPFKPTILLSSAQDILFTGNKLLEMNTPNPVLLYTGDLGVTDIRGTNVYRFTGTISHNTISGTNFGVNGAIVVRMNTTTNFVPVTFIPSNVYSAVIVSENHIFGSGLGINNGIQLLKGNGTQVLNNDVTVTGAPLYLVGNCDEINVKGNRLESTLGFGVTIPMAEGFEAPPSFSDMIFDGNTIITPPSDEHTFRNGEPIHVKNFTARNNKFVFLGAAGSGDAPSPIQFTANEGHLNIVDNTFYLTNSMSGRRVAAFVSTNGSTLNFSRNHSFALPGSVVTRRGIVANKGDAVVSFNDVGSCEFNDAPNLNFEGNTVTSGDVYPYCLETVGVGNAMIQNNFMSNYFAGSALVAVIGATNSTFEGNIVVGNSAAGLVVCSMGKMYIGNNTIVNTGVGVNRILNSPPGTISHIIYERPLFIDASDFLITNTFGFRRNGSPAWAFFNVDNQYTSSDRSIHYRISPDNTNDITGHVFKVRNTNGVDQFAFGAQGSDSAPVFRIGDSTNNIATFVGGLGTNTMVYLDNNRILQRLTLGANMTFAGGTLNSTGGGGGGSTNDTPWALDHDANLFSLTNAFGVRLRHNDGSAVVLNFTNTVGTGSLTLGTGGKMTLANTATATSGVEFDLNGASSWSFNDNALVGNGTAKNLGTTAAPYNEIYVRGNPGIALGAIDLRSGSGDPNGIILGNFGAVWIQTNASPAKFWFKETGTASTAGWVIYRSSATGTIPTTIAIACSDLTTPITLGVFKGYIRMPYAMTLSSAKASVSGSQTSGSVLTMDILESGVSVLGTKITIDNSEKTSLTAAGGQPTITDSSLANDAEVTVSVTQAGTSPTGLIVYLEGFR